MPVIPVLGTLRQDCEFRVILGYRVSSKPAGLHSKTLSQKNKKQNKKTSKNGNSNCVAKALHRELFIPGSKSHGKDK
jgi:hypothetical protein